MPDEVDKLIKKLSSSVWTDRSIAADSLISLGDGRAVQPLIKALHDAKEVVRSSAAEALGVTGDARAAEPLCKLLADTNPGVRETVAESLTKIGAPAIGPLCKFLGDKREIVWNNAAEILANIGAPAIVALVNLLGAADKDARSRAMRVLARFGMPNEIPQRILLCTQMSDQERAASLNALHHLDRRHAQQRLYYLEFDALEYCQNMAQRPDLSVRAAAEEIIRFLSLLRPGHSTGHDLVRAASGEAIGTSGEELLRGAEAPASLPSNRPGLLERMLRKLHVRRKARER